MDRSKMLNLIARDADDRRTLATLDDETFLQVVYERGFARGNQMGYAQARHESEDGDG